MIMPIAVVEQVSLNFAPKKSCAHRCTWEKLKWLKDYPPLPSVIGCGRPRPGKMHQVSLHTSPINFRRRYPIFKNRLERKLPNCLKCTKTRDRGLLSGQLQTNIILDDVKKLRRCWSAHARSNCFLFSSSILWMDLKKWKHPPRDLFSLLVPMASSPRYYARCAL